jgi:hypothetical protein
MKTFPVILRLDESDYNALSDEARRKGVSRSALLRTFLQNGLTRYDVKQEELLRRADRIEAALMDVLELSGVASGLLITMDVPQLVGNEKINARLLVGFRNSQGVMRNQQALKKQKQEK